MKVDLSKIKEALSEATPDWHNNGNEIVSKQNLRMGIGGFLKDEDNHLAANAPAWLASLVEHYEECAADAVVLHKQVEEMQKTQSLILKRVADISPSLAKSIIKEFALKGDPHDRP